MTWSVDSSLEGVMSYKAVPWNVSYLTSLAEFFMIWENLKDFVVWGLLAGFVKLSCHTHPVGSDLLCRSCYISVALTRLTLALVLLYYSNRAVPHCCCAAALSSLWFCLAAVLFSRCWCCRPGPHFDLYMTSAPVGHHAPFQPLVTGPHLHPSPASSPPSSSSPSTLPSSSQSSVTGPPRFSFSYPLLFPHDFLLVGEKAPSVSLSFHFYSVALIQLTLHPCVFCLQWVCLIIQLLPLSPYQVSSFAVIKQVWGFSQSCKANPFHFFTANTELNADLNFSASASFYVPHCPFSLPW